MWSCEGNGCRFTGDYLNGLAKRLQVGMEGNDKLVCGHTG